MPAAHRARTPARKEPAKPQRSGKAGSRRTAPASGKPTRTAARKPAGQAPGRGGGKAAGPAVAKAPATRATSAKRPKPARTGRAQVDARIRATGDWRSETLARLRQLIREADPDVEEDVKWRKPSNPDGVVAWSHDGLLCTGETYKGVVKITFARGASLDDPAGLFNAGFAGGTRRAIDLREGEMVDPGAFQELVRAAVARNQA